MKIIIRMLKSSWIQWVGHVARIAETKILVGKSERRTRLLEMVINFILNYTNRKARSIPSSLRICFYL